MNNSWETFQTAYASASQADKAIVDSETIPNCVGKIASENNIDSNIKRDLIKLFSLLQLKAINEEQVAVELKNSGVVETQKIVASVTNCLKGGISNSEVSTTTTPPAQSATKPVSRVRTMAADMKKYEPTNDKVYTSTQSAILNESKGS